MNQLSVIIITLNEARNIAACLKSVSFADEIIVLDGGKIAERGTHDKLLRKKGVYAAMWNRQREADQARSLLKCGDR